MLSCIGSDTDEWHYFTLLPFSCANCSNYITCESCVGSNLCEWWTEDARCARRGRYVLQCVLDMLTVIICESSVFFIHGDLYYREICIITYFTVVICWVAIWSLPSFLYLHNAVHFAIGSHCCGTDHQI